jgi:hypothetical protein
MNAVVFRVKAVPRDANLVHVVRLPGIEQDASLQGVRGGVELKAA